MRSFPSYSSTLTLFLSYGQKKLFLLQKSGDSMLGFLPQEKADALSDAM
jgi:hypothetical protein